LYEKGFDNETENEKCYEENKREVYDNKVDISHKIVNIIGTVDVEITKKINLNQIVRNLPDVEYNPERFPGLVMRIGKPHSTALIFSNGKMILTGLKKEIEAEKVIQKIIKNIRKAGFDVRNPIFTTQNIVATGNLHAFIDLNIAVIVLKNAMYEPEVFPGLIYKMQDPKIVFNIFSTGKFVCLGAKEKDRIKEAILKLNTHIRELGIVRKN